MSSNNSMVARATAWSTAAEFFAKIISPIINMVLARILTPSAFGIVATITMVISFAEIFTDAGFQKYIIQHEFENDDQLNKSTNVAFWTNLAVSSVACIAIYLFRDALAEAVGSPGLGNALSISSLTILMVAFSSIQMARYKRSFDFKSLFFVRIGGAFMPLVVTLPCAIIFKNFWAIIIGNFATHLFNAVVLTVKSKWKPKFFYSFKLFREMFAFSAWTMVESISIWLTSYIDIFLVGKFLNEYYLGLYKTSMSTVSSYMAIITASITPVLFSALSRNQNDDKLFKDTFYRFQRMVALFIMPMGVGIFVFSRLVTSILLGSQWMEAAPFIGLWGITGAITIVLSHFASEVYRSKGNPKISLLSQVIHLCMLVPTLIVSVKYGFEALYISRSIVRVVIVAPIFLYFIYGISFTKTLRNIAPSVISSVFMGLIGYFLKLLSENLLWQTCCVFLCIAVYFSILCIVFPKTRKEIMDFPITRKIMSKLHLKKEKKV